jgi:hypothetical protein
MPWQRQLPSSRLRRGARTLDRLSYEVEEAAELPASAAVSLINELPLASHLCHGQVAGSLIAKPALDRPIFGVVRHHRLCLHALTLYRIGAAKQSVAKR